MKHRIEVTEEDIATTEQGNPEACMVWRAVTRNLQLEAETGAARVTVAVFHNNIEFEGQYGGHIEVDFTKRVSDKIFAFDEDRGLVKPFSFDLNLPDDWREQVTAVAESEDDDD